MWTNSYHIGRATYKASYERGRIRPAGGEHNTMGAILYQWGQMYILPVGDSISFILSPGETLSWYIVSEGETFYGAVL